MGHVREYTPREVIGFWRKRGLRYLNFGISRFLQRFWWIGFPKLKPYFDPINPHHFDLYCHSTFNKESYIGKTIKSNCCNIPKFWSLGGRRWQYRQLLNVLGSFSDDRIQVLKQQHQGVSAARNNGLAKARFDWVAFLDADDWWDPHFLEALVAIVQLHPELKMVCSGRTRVFETNEERYENPLLPNRGPFWLGRLFWSDCPLWGPAHQCIQCLDKEKGNSGGRGV